MTSLPYAEGEEQEDAFYEVRVHGAFSAAHQLKDYEGNCSRLHGHNWKVELLLRGKKLDKSGILCDFRILKKALHQVTDRMDHCFLNELPELKGLSPSAEVLSCLIAHELEAFLKLDQAFLYRVRVWENEVSFASYYPRGSRNV